ncbi:MAG: ABC transporter transmembrane domain-containing protein [Pseudomonadota bacterium]
MKLPDFAENGRRRGLAMIAALALSQVVAAAAAAFATRTLFGDLHAAQGVALAAVAVLAASGLAIGAARIAFAVVGEKIGQAYVLEIREALLRHAAGLTASDIAARRQGYIALRFVGDLAAFRMWIAEGAPQVIASAIQIPAMLIVLTLMNPAFGAIAAIAFGAAICVIWSRRGALAEAHGALRSRRAAIAADMTELMPVAPELSQLGRAKREARRLRERTAAMIDASVTRATAAEGLVALADVASAIAAAAIFYRAHTDDVAPGAVAGALAALGIGAVALRALARAADHRGAFAAAEEKCAAALTRPRARPRRGEAKLPNGPLSLSLEGLRTPSGAAVSLSIPQDGSHRLDSEARDAADFIFSAIQGRERCAPGAVTIGGLDLCDVDPRSLLRRVALITTAPLIVRGSVRRNLTLGIRPRPSDAEIAEVSRGIGAGEALLSLDAKLSAGGAGLTRRDRLHVSLIRAALSEPGLTLVDDAATSLLASEHEAIALIRRQGATQLAA